MKKSLALIGLFGTSNDALELEVKAPAANLGQTGKVTCRFKLAEGEVFSHIGIYKNDKKDNGNHLAYLKGTLEEPEKWLKEDSKYSYELNIDVDDFKNAQIGINNVSLDDKGKYFCEFGFTKETPVVVTKVESADLDIYYPPKNLEFNHNINDDGVIEINCSTDESYPTSEIQSNLENPISVSDIKNGKSFKYALTPADNGNDLSCSVSHVALASDLTKSVSIAGPKLPDLGTLLDEEIQLGPYTLNNNILLVSDEPMEQDGNSLIFSSASFETANGSCSVNLKADVGKVYPPVTFVWFNDDQEIESAKGQDSVSLDVNALDNDKYVSVVADSVIGRSALRIEYRDRCFPPAVVPVSTTTPPAEPIKVTGPDVGEDGSVGEFGIGTEPVAVPFGDSLYHNESDVVVFQEDDVAEGGMGGPIIAAITAGSFFGLLLIGAAAYFLCCKSGEKTQSYKPNDKGGVDDEDYDITASVDLQDVAQVQQFNASNNVATSNPASSSGVKRSVSGTWNKPARTNSQAEAEQLLSSPKRTISTQTLEGKNETIVYGSTTSVHV